MKFQKCMTCMTLGTVLTGQWEWRNDWRTYRKAGVGALYTPMEYTPTVTWKPAWLLYIWIEEAGLSNFSRSLCGETSGGRCSVHTVSTAHRPGEGLPCPRVWGTGSVLTWLCSCQPHVFPWDFIRSLQIHSGVLCIILMAMTQVNRGWQAFYTCSEPQLRELHLCAGA